MAHQPDETELQVGELELRIDRLRSLYDQYFSGIEKLEPLVPRKDVERRLEVLRKTQIRNTALRFKFQTLVQRYNTYQSHWARIVRQIETGTYKRDVLRAKARFGSLDPAEAGRKAAADLLESAERPVAAAPKKAEGKAPEALAAKAASVPQDDLDLSLDDAFGRIGAPPVTAKRPATARPFGAIDELDDAFERIAAPDKGATVAASAAPEEGDPGPASSRGASARPALKRVSPSSVTGADAPAEGAPPAAASARRIIVSKVGIAAVKPPGAAPPSASDPQASARPAPPSASVPQMSARPAPLSAPAAPPPAASSPARPAIAPRAAPPLPPGASPGAGRPPAPPPAAARALAPPLPSPSRANSGQPAAPPPPPVPAGPVARPAPPKPAATEALPDERVRQLYSKYVETKRAQGESTAGITFEGLAKSLRESSQKVRERMGQEKSVDFEVGVKDGKTVLRPVVK